MDHAVVIFHKTNIRHAIQIEIIDASLYNEIN